MQLTRNHWSDRAYIGFPFACSLDPVLKDHVKAWWVAQTKAPLSGLPPAVAKRLEAQVHGLPYEQLVAFEAEQVKALLFEEGTEAWRRQARPWPSLQALKAALAEEQGYLKTRINLLSTAELLETGEVRRRQAEQVQQARLTARPAPRSSPGSSPGM